MFVGIAVGTICSSRQTQHFHRLCLTPGPTDSQLEVQKRPDFERRDTDFEIALQVNVGYQIEYLECPISPKTAKNMQGSYFRSGKL